MSSLFQTDDSDCISERPIAKFFLMSRVRVHWSCSDDYEMAFIHSDCSPFVRRSATPISASDPVTLGFDTVTWNTDGMTLSTSEDFFNPETFHL